MSDNTTIVRESIASACVYAQRFGLNADRIITDNFITADYDLVRLAVKSLQDADDMIYAYRFDLANNMSHDEFVRMSKLAGKIGNIDMQVRNITYRISEIDYSTGY